MVNRVKLPCELVEEILSHVPPKSLVRFRTVCKQWNALFDDKKFINNHEATFRFILATKSKIYSVSIDPKVEVRELELDIPGLENQKPKNLIDCNEFVLCVMEKGAAVLSPWLKQIRWIEPEVNQPSLKFQFRTICYDNTKKQGYKAFASYVSKLDSTFLSWNIYDSASGAWTDLKTTSGDGGESSSSDGKSFRLLHTKGVSLNGTLYLVAMADETAPFCLLLYFNYSTEGFWKFCDLPCGNNNLRDAFALRVFREDRFSLLKQCHDTKKIEIWVTKNKVSNNDDENVEWENFMQVSGPNLPDLLPSLGSNSQPSYFIQDKRLVVCSCDENGRAWIYVLGDNKLISKIQIDSVVDLWPLHCTYFPSLVPIPQLQRDEVQLQV